MDEHATTGTAGARPPVRVRSATIAVALTALAALTACTGASGTRAGGEPPPTTLTIGTNDPEGRPGADQIHRFAEQVDALSEGRLEIEPVFRVGEGGLAWDQQVARQVVSGELDLAMVPARAWDTEGVDSLRALHAPFLATHDATLDAVVTDEALAGDLLAGLDAVGVTGLALLPEGLRHLFLFGSTEPTLAALDGAEVRSPRSATSWATLEALGASPNDREPHDGTGAVETEFALAGTLPRATAVVGNLTLYPKVNSLVVNSEVMAGLAEQDRDVLRRAALAARDWAVDSSVTDTDRAREYCETGGTIVLADETELDRFRRAVTPVLDELRSDPVTAGLMDRIDALPGSGDTAEVAACSPDAPELPDEIEPTGGDLPDGTYRVEFTDAYLKSQGLDREEIGWNRGVWNITLRDGRWSVHQVAPDLDERFGDIYQVTGDVVVWRFYEAEPPVRLRWQVTGDGALRWEFLDGAADARFHFGLPWQRVD